MNSHQRARERVKQLHIIRHLMSEVLKELESGEPVEFPNRRLGHHIDKYNRLLGKEDK